jgi:hypothetical protein
MKSADDHAIRILITPGKETGHRVEAVLEEKELAAIGYVTTQWAMLEHLILVSTIELCSDPKSVPADAASLAFKDRLRAWRQTIEKFVPTATEKSRLLKLVSRAANLEQRRHKLIHGLWTSDPTDPTTLIAFSFRPRVEFEAEFDFDGLIKLGENVGELCFSLMYPGGKQQAYKAMADDLVERGGFISRSFQLAASDQKGINNKKRPRTGNRPKRAPRKSPPRRV